MPYLGNVIPKPHLKIPNNKDEVIKVCSLTMSCDCHVIFLQYLKHLQNFVAFYGATISANFLFVLVCMIIIYYKVFKRIRRMGKTQGGLHKYRMSSDYQHSIPQNRMRPLLCMEQPRP